MQEPSVGPKTAPSVSGRSTITWMTTVKRWLIAPPDKVPHYIDGTRRHGQLDAAEDVAKLATYEEAKAALVRRPGWTLGFALGPDGTGYHWQGADFDHVEKHGLAKLANDAPGYVEFSPSRLGAHAIGYGRAFNALGANKTGIEAYSSGRYFTVTEEVIRDGELVCLADFVEQVLAKKHGAAHPTSSETAGVEAVQVDTKVVAELRSALMSMRSDDYHLWIRMGFALRELAEVGRALWMEWSAQSQKFDASQAARKWETFRPTGTGHAAVFAEAQQRGWLNPASSEAQLLPSNTSGQTGDELLQHLSVDWVWENDVEVPDLIEGLVADEEVTLLGGHGGAGKSFLALQMACAVALGSEILGRETRQSRVLFYSAEDGKKRLTRRLRRATDTFGYDFAELQEWLRVLDASELEPLYGETTEPSPDGRRFSKFLGPRADYTNLQKMVEAFDPQLVVVDGASDTFDGNEIARREVRAFIKLLRSVHPHRRVAVLLLVHIDRASARGHVSDDEGYSGSGQWHNSARRRLYLQLKLERDRETKEITSESLLLRVVKNQDGPPDPDLELVRGPHGLLHPLLAQFSGALARVEEDHGPALLALIKGCSDKGVSISVSLAPQATTGVYATLKEDPRFPNGLNKKKTAALVRRLERDGLLQKEAYPRENRGTAERWAVVNR